MKGTLGSSGEQSRGARHVEAGLLDCLYRHRERERGRGNEAAYRCCFLCSSPFVSFLAWSKRALGRGFRFPQLFIIIYIY